MKEKKERIIPIKNYFIVVLLFVVLIGFTLYCSTWYKEITEYYNNNSVITEVVSEINLESLSSFYKIILKQLYMFLHQMILMLNHLKKSLKNIL